MTNSRANLLTLLLITIVSFIWTGEALAQKKVRFAYPSSADMGDIPSLLAWEQLKKQGIEVVPTFFPKTELAVQAVAAGEADMVLQDELLKIWEKKRQTIIFVTHDLVEAVALADQVVVMTHRPGKIRDVVQVPMSRPRNIFEIHRQDGFDEAYGRLWNIFRHELSIGAH